MRGREQSQRAATDSRRSCVGIGSTQEQETVADKCQAAARTDDDTAVRGGAGLKDRQRAGEFDRGRIRAGAADTVAAGKRADGLAEAVHVKNAATTGVAVRADGKQLFPTGKDSISRPTSKVPAAMVVPPV